MTSHRARRLGRDDVAVAKALFAVMARAFEEDHDEVSDAYAATLLERDDTWILAAFAGDEVVGGITTSCR